MLKTKRILLVPFVTLLLIVSSVTSVAFAANSNNIGIANKEAHKFQQILNLYVKMTDEGIIEFDEEKAISDGRNSEIIEAGRIAEEISMQHKYYNNGKKNGKIQAKVSFQYYGNWCGPGYGGGTPIDSIDQACKTHDLCYKSKGMYKCSCDDTLINTLSANWGKYNTKQKTYASGVITYFSLASTFCNK
ncbi:phospholipase A2 family protein [Domibacillus aminovorans]|uniref:Phospholipase A2-like central domain-containing protein n=1 Tax=Domibacillus aminovorans TaxID=29332 RepID=A0A177L3B6_9BACI|nr:phospholipase A2 family protein [Domibacillus aminovorans]OAH59862.1 hypothetical protein AWH49_18230 [Domibacillus aminovorans]